jgi:N-methylhydantoinase A/oxoprolinase/acetone carboxylase beta subunit
MIAYGGAGPLHAAQIAREIGTAKVIIPRAPGHFCAFGMLFSDLRTDFVRTCPARLAALDFVDIERIYGELEGELRKGTLDLQRALELADLYQQIGRQELEGNFETNDVSSAPGREVWNS